jgi:hypothetical protein
LTHAVNLYLEQGRTFKVCTHLKSLGCEESIFTEYWPEWFTVLSQIKVPGFQDIVVQPVGALLEPCSNPGLVRRLTPFTIGVVVGTTWVVRVVCDVGITEDGMVGKDLDDVTDSDKAEVVVRAEVEIDMVEDGSFEDFEEVIVTDEMFVMAVEDVSVGDSGEQLQIKEIKITNVIKRRVNFFMILTYLPFCIIL